MAKAKKSSEEQGSKAEESAKKAPKEVLKKYRVVIGDGGLGRKETYRADLRDGRGNITESFLVVDLSRTWGDPDRDNFERQVEDGATVLKHGEILEWPDPVWETINGRAVGNKTAVLLRAGAIREVK